MIQFDFDRTISNNIQSNSAQFVYAALGNFRMRVRFRPKSRRTDVKPTPFFLSLSPSHSFICLAPPAQAQAKGAGAGLGKMNDISFNLFLNLKKNGGSLRSAIEPTQAKYVCLCQRSSMEALSAELKSTPMARFSQNWLWNRR